MQRHRAIDATNPFSLDDAEIGLVRRAFDAAGFDEASIARACGVQRVSELPNVPPEAVLLRTRDATPLSTFVRLFVMGVPCPEPNVARACGELPLARWLEGGLVNADAGAIRPAVKMVHTSGVLVAFDVTAADGSEAADHVMGPSDSAIVLAMLTMRRACGDVLDIGTGCGLQSFLAARHATRVVATDINPRAIAFTRFNAALNACTNVEGLVGDRLAPVAGREFDLVVCNPPFVISPEDRVRYKSGGMKADDFCRSLVADVPAVMRQGGSCQMMCSWIERRDEDWRATIAAWFSGTGCDAWVLRSSVNQPIDYARGWLARGGCGADDPERLAAWVDYYENERAAAISTGVIFMRKRAGDNWFRAFDGPRTLRTNAGEAVRQRIDALDFLASASLDDTLLDSVLSVAPDVRLRQECRASAEGWAQVRAEISIDAGLPYVEEVDVYVGELIAACDGRRTLREAIARTAHRLGMDAGDVPGETADIVRQLVEEGFLLPS